MTELDQLRRLVEARAKATAGPWRTQSGINEATDRPAITITGARTFDRSSLERSDLRERPPQHQKLAYLYTPTEPAGPRGGQKVTRATIAEGEANGDFIALAGSLDLQAILAAWERDREELEKLRKPDLWWWRDDPEYNLDSPDQYIEDAGRRISGETVALLAAKSLPTRFFRVTDVAGSEDEDQEMVEITKEEYDATLPKGTQ